MGLEASIAFALVALSGLGASVFLLDLYSVDAPRFRWNDRWSFEPAELGNYSRPLLITASLLGLFLELLLIRWISSEIRIFAYFKNFVLIACFLGFGLGFHYCRRRIHLISMLGPLLLLSLLVTVPWSGLRELIEALPTWLGAYSEVHIWGVPALETSSQSLAAFVGAVTLSVPIFTLIALTFIPVGQLTGWSLETAPNGISAYTVNILSSWAGIILFSALSFMSLQPVYWFGVAAAIIFLLVLLLPVARVAIAVVLSACVLLVAFSDGTTSEVFWSPYQKLSLTAAELDGENVGYHLETNNSWYQKVVDLSPDFVAGHPKLFEGTTVEWGAYDLPYRLHPTPGSTLILGAGMGNDVAAALRNGSERVVAVEIDPLILRLGEERHPEEPYASPKVEVFVDDARSFIERADEQYDLIVFSLLDSHTNVSHFSNIRIDNYVYTVEAMEAARQLVAPDGLFIIKFQVEQPWIAERLRKLVKQAFGADPLQMLTDSTFGTSGRLFVSGSPDRIQKLLRNPRVRRHIRAAPQTEVDHVRVTTDDWPYFYQEEPGLPASVILMTLVLVGVCWLALRRTDIGGGSIQWHFFFLGAGFLLVEVQAVSKMALLFGTTWIVNSAVISVVLILTVLANILVERGPSVSTQLAYLGLAISIAAAYALPVRWLFVDNVWLRAVVAGVALCLPVFFAGIIFVKGFANVKFDGHAMGSNLFGALIGGMLESFSLWGGLKSLLVIAMVLYAASYVFRPNMGSDSSAAT